MEGLVVLIIYGAFGTCCALIAAGRGRSAVGWFIIGVLFTIFALIVLLVLPDLKVEQAKMDRLRSENRRLRERVKKDRQIADLRHREVGERVRAHDRALGLDTATLSPAPSELPSPPPLEGTAERFRELEWYFVGSHGRVGPLRYDELQRRWSEGLVSAKTLVWNRDMDGWTAVEDLAELEDDLRG